MPFTKILVHAVWGTKNRDRFLTPEKLADIITHIKENSIRKGIYITDINGYDDHIHCIISLNRDLSISKTIQLIKGESSFWANKEKIFTSKFEWADEYFAVSISESQLQKVKDYIANQQEHHKKKTFEQECEEFMKKYQFDKFG